MRDGRQPIQRSEHQYGLTMAKDAVERELAELQKELHRVKANVKRNKRKVKKKERQAVRLENELISLLLKMVPDDFETDTIKQLIASIDASEEMQWRRICDEVTKQGGTVPPALLKAVNAAEGRDMPASLAPHMQSGGLGEAVASKWWGELGGKDMDMTAATDEQIMMAGAHLATRDPSIDQVDGEFLDVQDDTEAALVMNWAEHGKRVFSFEKGMYEALRDTDIPGDLVCAEVQLPFPCIRLLLSLSPQNILVWLDQDTDGVIVVGVFAPHDIDGVNRPVGRVHVLDRWGFICLSGDVGLRVEDALASIFEDAISGGTDAKFGDELLRVIVNAVLYISSPRANMEPYDLDTELRLLREKLNRTKARRKRNRVERAIAKAELRRGEIVVRRPASKLPAIDEGGGGHLSYQFRVRGHWRNQACGPQRSLRRRLWIEPYWKGPDTAEVLMRDYSVRS